MDRTTITPEEKMELNILVGKCLKKDGTPRADADSADLVRLKELQNKVDAEKAKVDAENAKSVDPKSIEAVKVIAAIKILAFKPKDTDVVFDLGEAKITVGCIKQAKALLGE